MQWLFRPLVFLIVPTAAFLTFILQPVVGKQLMPRYGGTAGTWMTISFFFQAALLAGYALAFYLLRQPRHRAHWIVGALAVAAALSLRLPPWHFTRLGEWPAVLLGLGLALLPTVLLTTSVGIVLQGWIRERNGEVPYWLYGISNLGSLLALLSYPFVIEPFFGLTAQAFWARVLLALLGAGTLLLILLHHQGSGEEGPSRGEEEDLSKGRVALWAVTAFATCTLMLGAVSILSAEIGSNPLSWLLPLGMYLVSFTVTFSGWWRRWLTLLMLFLFACSLFAYMATKGITSAVVSFWPRVFLAGLVASGTLAGHGLLFQLRPARRFSFFYLVLAAAGMAAGLFASVGAPYVFDRNLEFVLASFLLLALLVLVLLGRGPVFDRVLLLALVAAPAAWFGIQALMAEARQQATRTTYLRNHYGTLVVRESPAFVTSSSETTLHGSQLLDPAMRTTPTTYYTRGSAAGMVLAALQKKEPALSVGVIGLGIGTLAAYGRSGDTFVFWDINPKVHELAATRFHFLSDSPARTQVRIGDGRLGVRSASERFDLLVVDAFSGDYIPMHLLTREAVQDYREKVGDGILLFHLSNRYMELSPVIGAHAQALGLASRRVYAAPSVQNKQEDQPAKTNYVLLFPASRTAEIEGWIEEHAKRTDYDFQISTPELSPVVHWTDDRHAIAEILWPVEDAL